MANSNIFTVGGVVQAGSGLYVSRRADEDLIALCRSRTFAYVLSSRQVGKSSLMIRAVEQLAREGTRSVIVELAQLGVRASAEEWYLGLLTTIADALMLKTNVVNWWQARAHMSMSQRLIVFFEEILLTEVKEPLVIFVDEIDTTLSLDFTDDFFAAVRYVYNARAHKPEFKRLSFVLIGVATPSDLIRDPQRTPFNIGRRVELADFTFEEALPLAMGLNLPHEQILQVLKWVLNWTGGHPYLTQRLCRIISDQKHTSWNESDVDRVVAGAFFGGKSERDSNLLAVRDMLTKRSPDLVGCLTTYREIRRGLRLVHDEEQSLVKSHLKLSGIVRRENNVLRVRNRIYRRVFDNDWVREHLTVNWTKRLARMAAALILTLLVLTVPLGAYGWYQRNVALGALKKTEEARLKADEARQDAVNQRQIVAAKARQLETALQKAEDAQKDAIGQRQIAENAAVSEREAKERAVEQSRIANEQAQIAQEQSQIAEVRRLEAKAESEEKSALNLLPSGGLLAIEAEKLVKQLPPSLQNEKLAAHHVLRDLLKLLPPLATSPRQLSEGKEKHFELAFHLSPEGRYLTTWGLDDQFVRVWDINSGSLVNKLDASKSRIMAISTDGKYLALRGDPKVVKVWDVAADQFKSFPQDSDVSIVALSSEAKYLATVTGRRTVHVWDLARHTQVPGYNDDVDVTDIEFSQGGRYLAIANDDGTVHVWDVAGKKEVNRLNHAKKVTALRFSPTGNYLATSGEDKSVRIWEVAKSREILHMEFGSRPNVLVFSNDETRLATITADHIIQVWDVITRQEEVRLEESRTFIVSFSQDGKSLITAKSGDNLEVKTWDLTQGRRYKSFIHDGPVVAAVFSSSTNILATATRSTGDEPAGGYTLRTANYAPKIMNVSSGRENENFTLRNAVPAVAFSANAERLALAGGFDASKGYFALVKKMPGGQETQIGNTEDRVLALAFSPEGNYLSALTVPAPLRSPQQDAVVTQTAGQPSVPQPSEARQTTIARRQNDAQIRIWKVDQDNEKEIALMSFPYELDATSSSLPNIPMLALSSNGQYLVVASDQPSKGSEPIQEILQSASSRTTLRIWQVSSDTWREFSLLGKVTAIALSDDGNFLATASSDKTATIWSVEGGRELKEVVTFKHSRGVTAVAISRNGQWLATGSEDRTARIWNILSKKEATSYLLHSNASAIAFDVNQEFVIIGDKAGTVEIWPLKEQEMSREACARLTRNFTSSEWEDYMGSDAPYRLTCADYSVDRSIILSAEQLAKKGDEASKHTARKILNRARELGYKLGYDPEVRVEQLANEEKARRYYFEGATLAEAGDLEAAQAKFRLVNQLLKAKILDPEKKARELLNSKKVATLVQQAKNLLVREGKVKEAIDAYNVARKEMSITPSAWNTLCWYGSIQGDGEHASEVMNACEQAVHLAPENWNYQDSRGVARALTGDFKGAIEDFETFIRNTGNERDKAMRQRWVELLRSGHKAPTSEDLKELRSDQ